MIFVITGTEKFSFDILIKEIDRLAASVFFKEKVFVQLGSCLYEPKHCEWRRFLSFGEMCEKIEEAETVIAHAGAGITLLCIQMGHKPLLIPRRKAFGEHVDDHQVSFARKFETTGMVSVIYEMEDISIRYPQANYKKVHLKRQGSRDQLIKYLDSFVESSSS